jgi:hypothetical protein
VGSGGGAVGAPVAEESTLPFFPFVAQEVRSVPVQRTVRRKEAVPVFKQEDEVVTKSNRAANLIKFYKTATQICNLS